MIKLTDDYRAAARAFKKLFGYGVPLRMIPPTETTEGLVKNIHRCLDLRKDVLREIYHIRDDGHILY